MSRIKSRDTKPEVLVRSIIHRLGYRFRKHVKALPGTPDIVLAKHKIVFFVHGCFWHQHPGCKRCTMPKSNVLYWEKKLVNNKKRDVEHSVSLKRLGWRVEIVWECEIKNLEVLVSRITKTIDREKAH